MGSPMSGNYFIFAKKQAEEALTKIGSVSAASGAAAADAAKKAHGEKWLEMVAIPESEISWAIEEKGSS
jgi:hypothetical protein